MSKTDKQTKTKTLVTLLLDRSGSMETVRDDTIGAINAYVDGLRASGDDFRFSLLTFTSDFAGDMQLERIMVANRVEDVKRLTRDDFVPHGGTPLIDAACATIDAVKSSLTGKSSSGTKVVFAIQTDGDENMSRTHSWADLKSRIEGCEEAGWEFVFMGCGINAYKQGARMGLGADKTMSYGEGKAETEAAFRATAANTVMFASGAASTMAYSAAQKSASGDAWADQKEGV